MIAILKILQFITTVSVFYLVIAGTYHVLSNGVNESVDYVVLTFSSVFLLQLISQVTAKYEQNSKKKPEVSESGVRIE